jgi:CarboxypepD_reg-like domain/TonB-dependent Receptor Plug Domain
MARTLLLLIFVAIVLGVATLEAQDSLMNRRIQFTCVNCTRSVALQKLQDETGLNMAFTDRMFQRCSKVTFSGKPERIQDIVAHIGDCAYTKYIIVDRQVVFRRVNPFFTLRGHVTDGVSGERLVGAGIRFESGSFHTGVISNEQGFFSIALPAGQYNVQVNYVGYEGVKMMLTCMGNDYVNLRLYQEMELPETVVVPNPELPNEVHPTGATRQWLRLEELRRMPSPGGEADVMRYTTLQTGTQSAVDGLGGLHVRGGNADQNLILLDDVPVYNPSHALGMLSIFNPSTVQSVRFWKGDQPSRFGGRLSSVMDVRTRDGNVNEGQVQTSVGLLASSITAETPLIEGKSALLIGARSTYLNPWFRAFGSRDSLQANKLGPLSRGGLKYNYYDLNVKYHHTFSERDRIALSYYQGGDKFTNVYKLRSFDTENRLVTTNDYDLRSNWGNMIGSLRWTHEINPKLVAHTTLHYSLFDYQSDLWFKSIETSLGRSRVKADYVQIYQTRIRDWAGKTDFSYYANNSLKMRWGAAFTRHRFQPGTLSVDFAQSNQSIIAIDSLTNRLNNKEVLKANDLEGYLEMDWLLDKRWRLEAGLRGAVFMVRNINHPNLQPRIRLQYNGRGGWSHWTAFGRQVQNLHQIGSFNISLPFELWVPSTDQVLPQVSWQVTGGLGKGNKHWNAEVEAYYKRFERVFSFLSNNYGLAASGVEAAGGWEDLIAVGEGSSRGVEAVVEKTSGRIQGTLAYTWSKAVRRFDDINAGKPFPFRFDRRHDLKFSTHYRLGDHWQANMIWSFATGNPITLTGYRYTQPNLDGDVSREVYVFSEINGYRLPNIHRLDLSVQASFTRGRWQHQIQFGAYNVYNRQNPFFLYLTTVGNDRVKGTQYTLLPLLPILRYDVQLGGARK